MSGNPMSSPKRRIVALAILALFGCAASAFYVTDGGHRLGDFVASLLSGSHDHDHAPGNTAVASASTPIGLSSGADNTPPVQHVAPPELHRMGGAGSARGTQYGGGVVRDHAPDANLFSLGDPSAGPAPGSFGVPLNQPPAGGPPSQERFTPFASGPSGPSGGPDTTAGRSSTGGAAVRDPDPDRAATAQRTRGRVTATPARATPARAIRARVTQAPAPARATVQAAIREPEPVAARPAAAAPEPRLRRLRTAAGQPVDPQVARQVARPAVPTPAIRATRSRRAVVPTHRKTPAPYPSPPPV